MGPLRPWQSPLYFVRRWTPALLRSLTPQPDENAPRINVSSVISVDVRRLPLPLSRPCCAGHKLTLSLEPRLGGSWGGSTKYSSTAVRALSTDGAGILQQTLVALEHEPLDTLAAALQCEHMVVSITGATTSPAFNQVRTDSRHPAVDPRVCTEFPSSEGRPPPSDTADSKDSRRTSSNGRRPHAPPPGVFRRRRVTQRGTRFSHGPGSGGASGMSGCGCGDGRGGRRLDSRQQHPRYCSKPATCPAKQDNVAILEHRLCE
jgi:hypothetical protein